MRTAVMTKTRAEGAPVPALASNPPLVVGSDAPEAAAIEIAQFFSGNEIVG